MPEAVIDASEISLNAVRYKLTGPIRRSLVSVYPAKLVTGDYTKDSSPVLSSLALSDHRGGIGLDNMRGEGDVDRSWYSTADIRFQGHLILPPLVTNTGGLPPNMNDIRTLMDYQGTIYAAVNASVVGDRGIYSYSPGTDAWSVSRADSDAVNASSRWAKADLLGITYIILGGVDRYWYFDGTTWTERIVGATGGFVTFWDDRIWGVIIGGIFTLWYTLAVGSGETIISSTPMSRSLRKVGQLFPARLPNGEWTLYLALSSGLWVYDVENDKWYPTGLQVPESSDVGTASFASGVVWRDKTYFASRSSVFEYEITSSGTNIRPIGPDRDHGLPLAKGHIISDMVASLNDLIISVQGNGSDPNNNNKTSAILAWNGIGWRVLHEAAGNDEQLQPLLVAAIPDIFAPYRLWFANRTTSPFNISYLPLPSDLVNPQRITGYTYAAAATHDWPWFTAGQQEVTKIAVRVKVETLNPTTAETVILSYATNWVETFTAFATITTAGITTFDFPNSTTPTGTAFRAIRFRAALARGSTNTRTPDVLSVTLEYYKKLDPKYQFGVELDLSNEYKGRTPKQLRGTLLTAQETTTLVEFTYRDPDANTDATFYVQVQPLESAELTGFDERGKAALTLREV